MKSKRQEKILDIIAKNNIETQEDLISALRKEGYNASIPRFFKPARA